MYSLNLPMNMIYGEHGLINIIKSAMFEEIKKEVRTILYLALPVLIAQASQTAISFVDTIMAGHYSAIDLSGVAIGNSIWLPTILFGHGLLAILTPIIAHLNGAGKREKIANQTRQGLILSVLISFFIILILYNSDKIITFRSTPDAAINPEMSAISINFLKCLMFGAPGYLFFQVLRNQCEGLSNTKPAMYIGFIALLSNIPLNYIFIYGKLGLPAFGGVGCGIATSITFWVMFFLMLIYVKTAANQKDIRATPIIKYIDFPTLLRIFKLGLPIALAYFFEVSLFALVSLLIAPLGEIAVAAHQIAFTIGSMTFVLPLSLSVATSIRVSYLLGEKQVKKAQYSAYLSLIIAFIASIIVAAVLVLFGRYFILSFNSDTNIMRLSLTLIGLLAIYQCSDYIQVTTASVLRGYKDTKIIFVITFFSYWIVGLPIGYILGLTDYLVPKMGPAGFWSGFICGLTVAAILLLSRMFWIQRQPSKLILQKTN